ncbi:hypothetical protein SAMN05421543_1801, partial [Alicyclobacillus macrosporangiidus]
KPPCPFGAQHYDENVVVVVYWWVIVIQHEAKQDSEAVDYVGCDPEPKN